MPKVSSAITFAYKVLEYAKICDYDVFFTGHWLGGWLAQITTFSTIYLTLDDYTGHFVINNPPDWDIRMPYTLIFDAPGALEFLSFLTKTVIKKKCGLTKTIDVKKLPVDVFLFHDNAKKCGKFHVGRVFFLSKAGVGSVDPNKYFGHVNLETTRLLELLSESEKTTNVTKWGCTGRMETEEDVLDLKSTWSVPFCFFNMRQKKFLEEQEIVENRNRTYLIHPGEFEGVNLADEETVNDLSRVLKQVFSWRCRQKEHVFVSCTMPHTLEFIPRVRLIAKYISIGKVWWTRRNRQLPANYVERRMCPTLKLKELTSPFASNKSEDQYAQPFSAAEVLRKKERLVVFVGQPGSGMSSAMTSLEIQLRKEIHSSPRVVLLLNLYRIRLILYDFVGKTEEKEKNNRFIEVCVADVPLDLLQQRFLFGDLPLYFVLDAIHAISPTDVKFMPHLLRHLLYDAVQLPFKVHQIILFTLPHLQNHIEETFCVKANSLVPLKFGEQVKFLVDVVGLNFDAAKSLKSLNPTALCLMGNPVMLSLYAEVVKLREAESVTNTFDMHAHVVAIKHELHVKKMEQTEQWTTEGFTSFMECNIGVFFAWAVQELYSSIETKAHNIWGKIRDLRGKKLLVLPSRSKLKELIEIGLLVVNWESDVRFQRLSFAEFFYAKLLTDEGRTSTNVRDVLLGKVYEYDVGRNVEVFVWQILLEKQRKRRLSKGWSQRDSMIWLGVLREEDAALYLEKQRLRRLVKGWLDCVEHKAASRDILIQNMQLHQMGRGHESAESCGIYLIPDRVKKIPGEFAGATNKSVALTNFYNESLFPVLCGWSILLSLEFTDQQILSRIITSQAADNIWWNEVVQPNFEALVGSTIIHTELVINLIQEKLITPTQMDLLMDDRTPNSHRATTLYKNASVTWKAEEVEKFKEALKKSGNTKAFSILNSAAHSI